MKNKIHFFGIITLAIMTAVALIACSDGSTPTATHIHQWGHGK